MTTFRDHMSAWLVVAVLATAGLGLWQRDTVADAMSVVACEGAGSAAQAGLVAPRALTWVPDPALVGLPAPADIPDLAAWEVAEARSPHYRESHGPAPLPRLAGMREPEAATAC